MILKYMHDHTSFYKKTIFSITVIRNHRARFSPDVGVAMRLKRKAREDDEDYQDVVQLALELGTIFSKSFDVKLKVRRGRPPSSVGCRSLEAQPLVVTSSIIYVASFRHLTESNPALIMPTQTIGTR